MFCDAVGKNGYAFLAAAKKWLEANKGLNKACLCKGKADRPGRLKVGGIKGKPGLLKGLYREGNVNGVVEEGIDNGVEIGGSAVGGVWSFFKKFIGMIGVGL